MNKWITTKEIVEKGLLTELELSELVSHDKLTAYESKYLKPIDWNECISKHLRTYKFYNTVRRDRIKIDNAAKWVPFDELHRILEHWYGIARLPEGERAKFSQTKLRIQYGQDKQICEKWNYSHVQEIISTDTVFKENEIQELIVQETNSSPNNTEISSKEKSNLLKIIGALVEIHYLAENTSNSKYKFSTGKPNISAIATDIHDKLKKNNFNVTGLADRRLRDTITEAIEAISDNKQ